MCGIAGYLDSEGAPADRACVSRMAALLAHRGPDGRKVEVVAEGPWGPTVVFGHTRLAIIDLSEAAAQPLANEDGSVVVTYNGEIYNFRELQNNLQALGHTFRSNSDTEVIVHAYETYGDDFVSLLDGMFALALWDGKRRRLLLARDRAGKKPLYYVWDRRRLTFASEIKALRACSWVDDGVAWERIPELMAFGYVPWPHSLYRNVCQVPPASLMVWEDGKLLQPRSYWSLRFADAGSAKRINWPEAEERVRHLLRNAVERRLMSDVPLGVLLSGGIDSSAIVALMAGLDVPVRTFTVGIEKESSYDERRFARAIASRFGTEHTEVVVRADAVSLLEHLLWHLDQPLADSSAIPTYLIARAAREHVTVALTGDGGDEVFGGYERFAAALLADRLPLALQSRLDTLAGLLPRSSSYYSLRRRVERFSAEAGRSTRWRYLSWVTLNGDEALSQLVSPDLLAGAGLSSPYASFYAAWDEAGDVPLLHRLLYANYRTYLHDDLLVKTDRMTMASSLEARSPFLDTALVEEIALLPPAMKATPFGLKRLLRRSFRTILPPEIVRRRKHGFGVPIDRWFRNELKAPFCDLVLVKDARSANVINQARAATLFSEHVDGLRSHGGRLWGLLALEVWLRMLERSPSQGQGSAPEILTLEAGLQ
jgi:asparagine synthase (glutamine-hydrolysing)